MKRKVTQILYKTYNLIKSNRLEALYNEVKFKNNNCISFSPQDLSEFLSYWKLNPNITLNPIMDKSNIQDWVKRVDRTKVYSWAYTGGSYGEPLRVPYSKRRGYIRTATFKYFNELGGYELGDPYALIRAKNKPFLLKYLRNETIVIPQDISNEKLNTIFQTLINRKIKVLMGYPTVMHEMAIFLNQNPSLRKKLRIKHLISVSEMLENNKREIIKNSFNCSFIDRYANEEVGLIAQQREYGGAYYVNKFGVYIEVVSPETLMPVREGEQGKVLVTDLYNDLIPIVRYDTGDLAIVDQYRNGQLFTIKKILGRETEKIYDDKGKPVSPLSLGPSIYKPLAKKDKLFQFQFAQKDKNKYELRIKSNSESISQNIQKEIINNLKLQLGESVNINIVAVENIIPQPSGKRPVYKNEMNDNPYN